MPGPAEVDEPAVRDDLEGRLRREECLERDPLTDPGPPCEGPELVSLP
ncbi:MAG: hypothetical protein ACM33U_12830 [Solirubrobacterales bacterium]